MTHHSKDSDLSGLASAPGIQMGTCIRLQDILASLHGCVPLQTVALLAPLTSLWSNHA